MSPPEPPPEEIETVEEDSSSFPSSIPEITEENFSRRRMTTVLGEPSPGSVPEAVSVEQPSAFPEIEPTIETDEPMVVVKARKSFDCTIGNRRWSFVKDKAVRVPKTVRDVLANAHAIHP